MHTQRMTLPRELDRGLACGMPKSHNGAILTTAFARV
jgi:hypothetical protein